tara:strand:+ start:4118 stop:4897 length:780 start_codon:yes stop_codon:yes gene_type:complete
MKISNDLDYKEILGLRRGNPVTDDKDYKFWWEIITKDPLFISYPRTGSHWINAVMELYLDRPRLPPVRATFLDSSRSDWGWFHDHDTIAWDTLHIKSEGPFGVIYLYRNPVDTVFSWIIYNFNNGQSLKKLPIDRLNNLVTAVSQQYRDHLNKWLIETPAKVSVRYENFRKDPVEEFSKIHSYWYGPDNMENKYNREQAQSCFNMVTQEALSKRRTEPYTLSDFMLTGQYKKDRIAFKEQYEDKINSIVITEQLKEFFE